MKGGNLKVSYCFIRQETVNSFHWFAISSQMSVPIVGLLVNWQVMHSSAICSWEVTEKTLLHHSISQLSCFVKARRCLQSILSWFGHNTAIFLILVLSAFIGSEINQCKLIRSMFVTNDIWRGRWNRWKQSRGGDFSSRGYEHDRTTLQRGHRCVPHMVYVAVPVVQSIPLTIYTTRCTK